MTAEQQLERSVLEGKERDELSAIAQAMSLKTTSRTKKADIIDQILDATGVTSAPAAAGHSNGDAEHAANGTKPARRPRTAAATTAVAEGDDATAAGSAEGPSAETPAAGRGRTSSAPAPTSTTEPAAASDSGPAVFVEPPELADGADTAPRHNGQGQGQQGNQLGNQAGNQQGNRNRQNQTNQNRGNNNQSEGDVGNRRSRRRRGRERGRAVAVSSRAAGRSSPTRASWSR